MSNVLVTLLWMVWHSEALMVKVCLYPGISWAKTHICRVPDNIYWFWRFSLVVKVIDFKSFAHHHYVFESHQGLWILSCEEAIRNTGGSSKAPTCAWNNLPTLTLCIWYQQTSVREGGQAANQQTNKQTNKQTFFINV